MSDDWTQFASIASPLLSLGGAYIGAMVALARHDERIKVIEREMVSLRKRTHRISDVVTVLAAKAGIRNLAATENDDG